jgi:hypothetical protein
VANFGNFNYTDAPMNFLEIYDGDILYASGLSQCEMIYIMGSPASIPPIPPDVNACQATTTDTQNTQKELNQASQKLLSIAEPAGSWKPRSTRGHPSEALRAWVLRFRANRQALCPAPESFNRG